MCPIAFCIGPNPPMNIDQSLMQIHWYIFQKWMIAGCVFNHKNLSLPSLTWLSGVFPITLPCLLHYRQTQRRLWFLNGAMEMFSFAILHMWKLSNVSGMFQIHQMWLIGSLPQYQNTRYSTKWREPLYQMWVQVSVGAGFCFSVMLYRQWSLVLLMRGC